MTDKEIYIKGVVMLIQFLLRYSSSQIWYNNTIYIQLLHKSVCYSQIHDYLIAQLQTLSSKRLPFVPVL